MSNIWSEVTLEMVDCVGIGGRVGGGLQNMVKKMSPLRDLWWIIADSAKTIEHKTSLLN